MQRTIFIALLFAGQFLFSQNPLLKVYVDTKEISETEVPVYAFVKYHGKFYSLLRNKDKTINLPEDIEFYNIEGLRFIVKTDTIAFSVNKILEDLKKQPEKNAVDELYSMFREIAKWELRIDNFKYAGKEQALTPAKETQVQNTTYVDYKMYSLRTINFKYYVVKA